MQELRDVANTFPLKLGLSLQQVQASANIHAPSPLSFINPS